jgi:membrane-bound ClpP family serine protease
MLTIVAVILAFFVVPSPWGVVLVVGAFTVDVLETIVLRAWSRRRRAAVGRETIVGRRAVVVTTLAPEGQVRVDGEIWQARAADGLVERGADVTVLSVTGLVLEVERPRAPGG